MLIVGQVFHFSEYGKATVKKVLPCGAVLFRIRGGVLLLNAPMLRREMQTL